MLNVICVDRLWKKRTDSNAKWAKHTINCFQSWIFLLLYVECHFRVLSQCQYFQRSIFNQGLFIRFSAAVAGVTCPRHLESFFLCPVQLCNYFPCALPVESSPKLHVSRCGKYMTFGAASPRENNEQNCAMLVALCFFFSFFLFVRLCGFFLAEQKLLSSPNFAEHFWRRLEQPLITCGRGASFLFRNSEQHAYKKWNKTVM